MRKARYYIGLFLLVTPLMVPWIAARGTGWVEIVYQPLTPHTWYGIESIPLFASMMFPNATNAMLNSAIFQIPIESNIAVIIVFMLVGTSIGVRQRRTQSLADLLRMAWLGAILLLIVSWLVAVVWIVLVGRYGSGSTVGFSIDLSPLAGFWLAPIALITVGGLRFLPSVMRG